MGDSELPAHRQEREGSLVSEAQKRAKRKYDTLRTTQIVMRLRVNQDADVIEKLRSVPSKVEYIRSLVRRDIKDGQKEGA